MKMLLEHPDTNVNRWDSFLQTPIYLTVRYRRPDILQLIVNHKYSDLILDNKLSIALNPLYLSARLINKKRLDCFKILLNIGFEVRSAFIEILLDSGNREAIRLAEMSVGKVLSTDHKYVLTLKQLCRVVLRNKLVAYTNRPIVRQTIDQYFSVLPNDLLDFLVDLNRYR